MEYRSVFDDISVSTKRNVDVVLKAKKLQDEWEKKFGDEDYVVPLPVFFEKVLDVSVGPEERRYITSIIDPYNFGSVSPLTFKRFIRTFGDLNKMSKKVRDLVKQPYFQGFWEARGVQHLLLGEEVGTFLVYFLPGRMDRMALAYVQPDGVSHHRIIFNKDGKILLNDNFLSSMDCSTPRVGIEGNMSTSGSVALPKEEDVFDNLQSLVESYSRKYCWKVYNNSLINGVMFMFAIVGPEASATITT
eukprot:TRINITY_DN3758_c0_g2_i5.p1 TRINITY_DN3758_c0_g2~~TRINITY_DN3758_c0_g2_i5.p1  ORF type:complete len:246 (+),score=49.06 TRINITY_DN3758_c0_g2_i5:272-1009(+)